MKKVLLSILAACCLIVWGAFIILLTNRSEPQSASLASGRLSVVKILELPSVEREIEDHQGKMLVSVPTETSEQTELTSELIAEHTNKKVISIDELIEILNEH